MPRSLDRRRLLRLLAVTPATAPLAWLAACGDGRADHAGEPRGNAPDAAPSAPTLPVSGGTLRLAVSFDPDSLDPLLAGTPIAGIALRAMTDTLVRFTDDLRVGPGLVQRWEIGDEGTVSHFTSGPTLSSTTTPPATPRPSATTSPATAPPPHPGAAISPVCSASR